MISKIKKMMSIDETVFVLVLVGQSIIMSTTLSSSKNKPERYIYFIVVVV